MPRVEPLQDEGEDVAVFLSASIPDPKRWSGDFDAYEITEAVTSAARVVLRNGWKLVTAAHPTVAPMLLYVAAEQPREQRSSPRVIVYQSQLFQDVLPRETARFAEEGVGTLVWTDAVEGETAEVQHRSRSLALMRHRMLSETSPAAAVFIGGMDGIRDEAALFGELYPERPQFAVGRPGGEARRLAESATGDLAEHLLHGDVYPTVFRQAMPGPREDLS